RYIKLTHPASTLFPYTTLFRSRRNISIARIFSFERMTVITSSFQKSRYFGRRIHHLNKIFFRIYRRIGPIDRDQLYGSKNGDNRSEEHTSELQSRENLVCRLLL